MNKRNKYAFSRMQNSKLLSSSNLIINKYQFIFEYGFIKVIKHVLIYLINQFIWDDA